MYNSSTDNASKDATINVNNICQYNDGSTLLAEFVLCQNLIHMKGIKYLYDDLPQQKLDNVEQLRQRYTHALLDDIAAISKLLDANLSNPVKLEFKDNFYDEAFKMPQNRSKEYNEFIKRWAQQSDALPLPYKLSAKLLLALDKKELDSTQLQEQLMEILNHDKQVSTTQCDKDFNRAVIGYRGKDKVARQISLDELKNSPDLNLTNEQREFIASYWHQGTFTSATYMYLSKNFHNLRQTLDNVPQLNNFHVVYNENQEVGIFIDANADNTKIYNVVDTYLRDVTNAAAPHLPWASTSMSIDISNMKGSRFIPSCASFADITIYMHQLYKDHDISVFDIPKSLNVSTAPVEKEILKVKSLFTQACIHSVSSMKQNTNRFDHEQLKAWASLEKMYGIDNALGMIIQNLYTNDQDKSSKIQAMHNIIKKISTIDTAPTHDQAKLESYNFKVHLLKESMVHFCKIEHNEQLRNQFTDNVLNLFVEELHNNHGNIVSIKDVKKDIVEILSPLCTNNSEVKALQTGISKVIGKDIESQVTIKRLWKTLKTKILDVVDHVLQRNKIYKNITKKYPVVIQQIHNTLSKHLKINKELQGKKITTNNKKARNNLSKS